MTSWIKALQKLKSKTIRNNKLLFSLENVLSSIENVSLFIPQLNM